MPAPLTESPLAGFWMGGFEGADHLNGRGVALDMSTLSGHTEQLQADHRRAAEMGLSCVRESIGWRLAEDAAGRIDLSRARRIAASARQQGLQVLWTLMHYGVPDGLSLHDDALIPRFARFAAEVARVIGGESEQPPVFTPINEINFLAWAASQPGLLAPPHGTFPTDPDTVRLRGYTAKRRLVQATLAAMDAMRAVEPRSRFLHVEPVVHVVAPDDRPDLMPRAQEFCDWQWQAWDLLCGRQEPELGGSPDALDLLGVNHYHDSQWEFHTGRRLEWHLRDPRRRSLSQLLADTAGRYGRPVVVAETGHFGAGRADWLHDMAAEARTALREGVPLLGMCLYPLVDRPDWNDTAHWHRSGLWHVDQTLPEQPRVLDREYAHALQSWQAVLPAPPQATVRRRPLLLVYSHLPWNLAAHRTRHLMEHLAAHWHIVCIEEPVAWEGPPRLDALSGGPHIEVLTPHIPRTPPGFARENAPALAALLHDWLDSRGLVPAVQWISTPMALPLARLVAGVPLVYDCVDELGGYRGASPELPVHESDALRQADLVLAAGPSLQRSRAQASGRTVHLIANALRLEDHAPRTGPHDWASAEAECLQPPGPGPRLGYAGVIDERIDLELLASLADARPQWQIVMLGPVVRRDPATLPRRPNLHWLGAQPRHAVPAFLAGWHVGLVPFLPGPATDQANPLKVLEYLAAGLPVVSTPIPDLAPLRQAGVCLAPDAAGFLACCDACLNESASVASERQGAAAYLVSDCNWTYAAERVHTLLLGLR